MAYIRAAFTSCSLNSCILVLLPLTPPAILLLSKNHHETANKKVNQEWPGSSTSKEKLEMRTRYPTRLAPEPAYLTCPLFLYVEGPPLPARPVSVIVLDVGLYLDRVRAGGKPLGGACYPAAGPPIAEPHRLAVEGHVYVVLGQEAAPPVLHVGLNGGPGSIDPSGGAHRGYDDC